MATEPDAENQIEHFLTVDNINPFIKEVECAFSGPVMTRAIAIKKELAKGVKKPFTYLIQANLGDAHFMGQKPITFIRQVLALIAYPELLNSSEFPEDVKSRARALIEANGGSVGCYSVFAGLQLVRNHVAQYIERRDGFPSNPDDVFLCDGASAGIRNVLKMFCTRGEPRSGVMIPIPTFALYPVAVAECNMEEVDYYLDEDNGWDLDVNELERAIKEAKERCNVRVIIVVNPGNPTGQVLTRDTIVEVIKFAHREKLVIFADEVYQGNIYAENMEFHSFKKVAAELGDPYDKMELVSFMSCSKGYMGECGLRGGYVEVANMSPEVKKIFYKFVTFSLCSNIFGQAALECAVNPPRPDEPSYELFIKEKEAVLESFAKRARMVATLFNSVPGIRCNDVQGALYAFPRIDLPDKAIAKAESLGQTPDVFYTLELLEETGIWFFAGAEIGQRPGTYHFRTTILPPEDVMLDLIEKFRTFHCNFLMKYQ